MKILKRISGAMIMFVFTFFMFAVFSDFTVQAAYTGIGEKRFEWDREIYDGVNLRHTMSYNQNRDQKTYTVEFNPKTTALKPVVTTGPNVLGGNVMSKLVSDYENRGQHVVFGVNGDGYDTSNGVPSGIGINDGILLNSSTNKMGWGITASGEVKYGSANLPMTYTIAGQSARTLHHVNKERKTATSGVYLLTENFSSHTNSTEAGVEVILSVDGGADLRIGQDYNLTVQEVKDVSANPSRNKTPIGTGKAVLATPKANTTEYNMLKALTPGTKIKVNVNDNTDNRINWTEIVAGMGIFHMLLDNGVEHANLENTDVHPRTAMGLKADGTVILMQNDGRQPGWAAGFTFREMVDYMRDEFDAVTVFNFDGGGSSTIAATLPGDETATVLNRPSDGRERSNANAFLLVADEGPVSGKPVEKLHIYPSLKENYGTKGMLLEKTKLSFNVAGTDRNFYPVPLSGNVTYRIENEVGNIGTVTSEGMFTATTGTGKGKVIASYGSLEAAFDIEVVNSITSIERDFTIISVAPKGTSNLDFRALKDGVPIIMSNEALTFQLSNPNLGSVSAGGVFTAVDGQGTGNLKVSYKTFELTIPVEVGRLPEMILDFEEDIFSKGWQYYYVNPGNGGSGSMSMNNDERYVKHGDGSLKIDYDFKTNPLKGTVSMEIGQVGGTVLEGQPSAISAWVYGDGNGAWFRIQLAGGVYVGDVYVNWTGWKYIETPIPDGAEWPIEVHRVVRLLGTATTANNTKGTVYVDSVRAIYGFDNDDDIAPTISENSITPKNNSVTANNQQEISFLASDAQTGINRARTQMYINGKLVDNLQQTVNQDGSVSVSFNPSALTRLENGVQNVKVRVEDNFGNKTFKEWKFTVTSSALTLNANLPNKEVISAGESFSYQIVANNKDSFSKFDLEVGYDKDNLVLDSIEAGQGVAISSQNINAATGKGSAIFTGMESAGAEVVTLNFTAKARVEGSTSIYITKAKVTSGGTEYDVSLPSYDVPLKQKHQLVVSGLTPGSTTTFTLTDDGLPVVGAEILVKHNGAAVNIDGLTNSEGKLSTTVLTSYPLGTEFEVYAIKDGVYSNTLNVAILGGSGLVTAVDGASIRVKTENSAQGLRFTAKLETGASGRHGFYIVYGKTTTAELYSAISSQGNNIVINGKKVFVVEIPGTNAQGEFHVVLTGIPEAGYLDNISVFGFVEDGGQRHLVEQPVTRSVTEVALKMHAENLGGQEITNILNKASTSAMKYAVNAAGNYELAPGLYETSNTALLNAFLRDWNAKFKTNWTALDAKEFFDSAKEGTNDEANNSGTIKDISNLNIYKFFNDPIYKNKWAWFLDYLLGEDGTTHVTRQITAIKGNGTNGDFLLYNTDHLSYSIYNFFHQSHEEGFYTSINFTQLSRYENVKGFNFAIFADASLYEIVKAGDVIKAPAKPADRTGYVFDYYLIGDAQLQPGTSYTISVPGVFTPVYKPVSYTIKYYDGSTELTDLFGSYNIETMVDLPTPEKSGYGFKGWYNNPSFSGSPVTSISVGTTGNKEFYAKWEEVSDGTYTIEYVLDGGQLFGGYETREEMIQGFLTDFYTWLGSAGHLNTGSVSLMDFMHGTGKTSGYAGLYESAYYGHLHVNGKKGVEPSTGKFINQNGYNQRWSPLMNVFDEYILAGQNLSFWASTYTAKLRIVGFVKGVSTWPANQATVDLLQVIPNEYEKVSIVHTYTVDTDTIVLPQAVKAGMVFEGWYTEATGGTKVTSIPKGSTGNKKLYARWA